MDAADLQIRGYEPGDRERILELNEVVLRDLGLFEGDGPDFEDLDLGDLRDIEGAYLDPGGIFLVGELNGELVASGGFYPVDDDIAKLRRMRVAPDAQRSGIGGRLLSALEARARRRGFATLTLDTMVEQTAARRFYRVNGYERTRRAEFEGFDSVFFEKHLGEVE